MLDVFSITKSLFLGLMIHYLIGCGVNAGNPDSSAGTKGVISFFITDAPVDEFTSVTLAPESLRFSTSEAYVVDLSGDEIDLLNYRNGKTLSLMNDFEVAVGDISAFQLLLSESNQMLTGTNLEGEDESIIILDDNGDPADHLVFAGQQSVTESVSSSLIVDVDLQKSMRALTETEKENLNLDSDIRFAIQQSHNFYDRSKLGTLTVSNLAAGSKLCLSLSSLGDSFSSCLGASQFPGTADDDGELKLITVQPGTYQLFLNTSNQYSKIGSAIIISEGDDLVLDANTL